MDNIFQYLYTMTKKIKKGLIFVLSLPVYFYKYAISPYLRPSCRHVPTCSQYMLDALQRHGPFKGFVLGCKRILRCRPGGTHGYDPVPLFTFKKYKSVKSLFVPHKKCNILKH